MDKLKGALVSKTAWFGLALAVLGALQQYADLFKAVLPEKYYGAFMSVVGVVVLALRFMTGTSLEDKVSDNSPGA